MSATLSTQESNQAVFDAALTHIRKQKVKSVSEGYGYCVYRQTRTNDVDLMCAFGPCIKEYDDNLEGHSASVLLDEYSDRLHDFAKNCDPVLADEVQYCHDGASDTDTFLEEFEKNMKEFADGYGLVYTPH